MTKRRVSEVAVTADNEVIVACEGDEPGETHIITGHVAEEGKAIPPGVGMYQLGQDDDGAYMETLVEPTHKGPARASSKKYRTNYDRVFKKTNRPKRVPKEMLN